MTPPSPKEQLILNLLRSGKKMYGLEMVKADNRLKRGTIYVTLERMIEKGLLESRKEEVEEQFGWKRFLYKLSKDGLKTLNAIEAYNAVMENEI